MSHLARTRRASHDLPVDDELVDSAIAFWMKMDAKLDEILDLLREEEDGEEEAWPDG